MRNDIYRDRDARAGSNPSRDSIDVRLSAAIQQYVRAKERANHCHEQLAGLENRAENRLTVIKALEDVRAAQQKIDRIEAEKDSKILVPRNRKSRGRAVTD